jgi:hypothetical protein
VCSCRGLDLLVWASENELGVSYTYTYLVPLNGGPEPPEYGRRVKEFLLHQKVITEETDKFGMFGPGENSMAPFKPEEGYQCGFDYGHIFAGPHLTIVPEDDGALEPSCPSCRADLGLQLNQLLCPDETAETDKIDFTELTVTCPQCKEVFRPDELVDGLGGGIFLTWELDKAAGTAHRARSYWYT